MKKPRFKIGDRVVRDGRVFRVTAIGPRDRRPGEEPWYGLSDGEQIRPFRDAWQRELESAGSVAA